MVSAHYTHGGGLHWHVPLEVQKPPAHGQRPSRPQLLLHITVFPQLLTSVPLQRLPQGSSGVHPQALGPAPPPPHVLGLTHVSGHVTT